jgi:hypothetical protein
MIDEVDVQSPMVLSNKGGHHHPTEPEWFEENMLVIQGNTTVADIHLTEFFRLWNHYAFSEWGGKESRQFRREATVSEGE